VATPTTTGCPASAPLWHVLYQVREIGASGVLAPAGTLAGAQTAAATFADLVGTSTNCALRVTVTVEDVTLPPGDVGADSLANVDGNSSYYDVVIDRIPSNPTATSKCPVSSGSMANEEPMYTSFAVTNSVGCGGPNPAYPDATGLMWALTTARGAQYGYGLPNRQWSMRTQMSATLTATLLWVRVGDASIVTGSPGYNAHVGATGEAYGGVIVAAVSNSGGRVVAHGTVSHGALLFPHPLKPGSYRACLNARALGRWQAATKCVRFTLVAESGVAHGGSPALFAQCKRVADKVVAGDPTPDRTTTCTWERLTNEPGKTPCYILRAYSPRWLSWFGGEWESSNPCYAPLKK
jgi:hypothetical protein